MEVEVFLKRYNVSKNELMEPLLQGSDVPMVIKGNSGSGKTLRFLTRIAYLLESGLAKDSNMLNLVYDAKTARRMNAQYKTMFGEEYHPMFVDMFSFCYRIVQFYDENNGHAQRTVYRDMEKAANRILNDTFKIQLDKQNIIRLLQKINECKNLMLSEKDIAEITFMNIDFPAFYNAYEKFKKNKKIYDQGDVVHEALHILMYDTEIVELYRQRFQYINVDDAQELSYASHMILRLLHAQKDSLCAFMDESQCIDINNSAYPEAFDMWEEYYGGLKTIELTQNHRMNKSIASIASKFANGDETSIKAANDEECDVKYKGFSEWKKMYDYALRLVKEEKMQTAFLYREVAYALPLVDIFRSNDIPVNFRCNIKKYMAHPIVKDLCNFVALFHNPRNIRAFFEIHEKMGLDMSNRILLEIDERVKNDENADVYQAVMESGYKSAGRKKLASCMEDIRLVSTQTTFEMIQYILDKHNYYNEMKTQGFETNDAHLLSIQVMAERYPDSAQFLNVMKELMEFPSDEQSDVIVSDIFSSKGQEYSRVCILDCFASVYPKDTKNEDEEKAERNLFFVAITRAMDQLEFFTSKRCFQARMEISPFIFELHGKQKTSTQKVEAASPSRKLKENDLKRGVKILHTTLGVGKIMKVKEGMMQVQFAEETKMLNVKLCIHNKLVEIA